MRSIDHHSPIPYYHQLADILREEIEQGRWHVDELIPAEGALTEIFGISRSVTRKALDVLEGEGRVLRIKGKGTVVTRPKFGYEAVGAAGRWFAPRSKPARLSAILSSGRVPAGGNLGRLLDVSARDELWEIVLTHSVENDVASLSQVYLLVRGTLTVSGPLEFEVGGPDILQQLAVKYGLEITDSQLEMDVTPASGFDSAHLGVVEGSPVVQISSLDSAKDKVVGFIRTVVRPDHFFFAVDMHRDASIEARRPLTELMAKTGD